MALSAEFAVHRCKEKSKAGASSKPSFRIKLGFSVVFTILSTIRDGISDRQGSHSLKELVDRFAKALYIRLIGSIYDERRQDFKTGIIKDSMGYLDTS